jgi:hypothetical protein
MSISEFCDVFHADINVVVNAEEIKAKNQVIGAQPTPVSVTGTKRGRPRKNVDMGDGFNVASLQGLQGKGLDEQLRFIQQCQSQLDAYASQLKVAK